MRGLENDVYFQVGLVTLVGLSAKNAILICEVAIERVRDGMAAREAALEAAGARLRAIVMTSLAFGLGCVPLAIASGPGANSLRAIGTGVIGGILASIARRDLLRAAVLLAAGAREREGSPAKAAAARTRQRRSRGRLT